MTNQEQAAVLTISLMAAFADGGKSEDERAQLKSIADSLSAMGSVNLAGLYQDVLLKRRSLAGLREGCRRDERTGARAH